MNDFCLDYRKPEKAELIKSLFLKYQDPQADIYGSRDATRMAFNLDLIEEGDVWMDMIKDRNRTSHTYNQDVAREIVASVRNRFFALFVALQAKMQAIYDESDD